MPPTALPPFVRHRYEQVKDTHWDGHPETKGGACYGLSVHWIIRTANHGLGTTGASSFWGWLYTEPGARHKVRQVMAAQGHEDGHWAKLQWARSKVLHKTRLRLAAQGLRDKVVGHFSHAAMVRWMLRLYDSPGREEFYSLCGFGFKKGGNAFTRFWHGPSSHAVAAHYRAGGAVRLMDPNGGEMVFRDRAELEQRYQWVLKDMYHSLSWKGVLVFQA